MAFFILFFFFKKKKEKGGSSDWKGERVEVEGGSVSGKVNYFFFYFGKFKKWEWMGEDKRICLLEDK
ncbi:hypothetical protein SDC9_176660 [bioreactor metagenome]|uniref:Uncharacterized protein n=1 Tax=bioreactor metagenome TaxID=1076179 RepID=A0A645GTP5_9ZZZZ